MADWDDASFRDSAAPRPNERRGERRDYDRDDDFDRLIVRRTPFPALMIATGILWILAGGAYVLFFAALRLLGVPFQGNDIWLVFGAFFFVKDGIQLIRGKFRDPQFDGVISVLVGIFLSGQAVYRFRDMGDVVVLGFGMFFGVVFLVPGVLVLIGRKQYVQWLTEQTMEPPPLGD